MGFDTQELGVVAALSVTGFRPRRVVKRNGRAAFEFGPEVGETVRAFYDGSLTLGALAYSEALRTAKAQALNALPEPVPIP